MTGTEVEKKVAKKPWQFWKKLFTLKKGKSKTHSRSQSQNQLINDSVEIENAVSIPSPLPVHSEKFERKLESVETAPVAVFTQEAFTQPRGCILCLQETDEWFCVDECQCQFCIECMEMYTVCSVRSGHVPVTCPDGRCPKMLSGARPSHLTPNEVESLVPPDVFSLYVKQQVNKEVSLNPNLMWCPRPGCESVCLVSAANAETLTEQKKKQPPKFLSFLAPAASKKTVVHKVSCSTCLYTFCSTCKTPWHGQVPCPAVPRTPWSPATCPNSEDPIVVLEREGFVKRCPFCVVPIERDEGCAQMMCKQCRHVFCWFCLASLDDDFMLRHYDSGPCRSRLGHTRLSVVWHRIQVLAVFLGLGVVFLAASPLLLLASPCLLCFRHHLPFNQNVAPEL